MGITVGRIKLSAPPTTEGRHLLSMVNCDFGGGKHSLDVWLTERVIAIPVENNNALKWGKKKFFLYIYRPYIETLWGRRSQPNMEPGSM